MKRSMKRLSAAHPNDSAQVEGADLSPDSTPLNMNVPRVRGWPWRRPAALCVRGRALVYGAARVPSTCAAVVALKD